jgi:hypothetical protein
MRDGIGFPIRSMGSKGIDGVCVKYEPLSGENAERQEKGGKQ